MRNMSRGGFLRGAAAAGAAAGAVGLGGRRVRAAVPGPSNVLADVLARGFVRIGLRDSANAFVNWNGPVGGNPDFRKFEPRLAQGVVAALFGKKQNVKWVTLNSTTRFTHVMDGTTDVNFRTIDFTSHRDCAGRGVNFSPIYYIDQAEIWAKPTFQNSWPSGARIGAKDSAIAAVTSYMADKYGSGYTMVNVGDADSDLVAAWNNGTVDAVYTDGTSLLNIESQLTPSTHFTPDVVGKAPWGATMSPNDPQMNDFINWCIWILFAAEEYTLKGELDTWAAKEQILNDSYQLFGLTNPNWATDFLDVTGHYGDLFALVKDPNNNPFTRELRNKSYVQGGTQYAPKINNS